MGFKAGDKVRLKYDHHGVVGDGVVTLVKPKLSAAGSEIPGGWIWVPAQADASYGAEPWDYEEDFEYLEAERQDWTGLCDRADEFIAALKTTGQYILAGIIADLKNALIEESYR